MKAHHLIIPAILLAGCSPRLKQANFSPALDVSNRTVTVITTAKNTSYRLTPTATLTFNDMSQPLETQECVFVDPSKRFQTIIGIGGAITDASAETFAKLPAQKQRELLTSYYDKTRGIGYSLARTNINSCDFSSDTYTYVADNDSLLKTFDISHDEQYKIPLIKQATRAAGGKLTLFVSPWSPPAWMKDNRNMLKGGKLLPSFRQSWASYLAKFIKTYEAMDIPVWGLSVQNEPMATQTWESCVFTAAEERDFVKNYLGPTLHRQGLSDKKLIIWDHNRDLIYQRASTILSDPDAAKYVWGVGYHWYETWTKTDMNFANLKQVHEAFPEKNLLFTEGCIEQFDLSRINDWKLGEKYGNSMINDFNSGTTGWTDWNILLDEKGGPNHVGNYCFAPIHADTKSGNLLYTNIYYYIGHFSKYLQPGARRIASSASRTNLQSTAFINPDGKIIVVVLNLTDEEIPYSLWITGKGAKTNSLPHSITTLVF